MVVFGTLIPTSKSVLDWSSHCLFLQCGLFAASYIPSILGPILNIPKHFELYSLNNLYSVMFPKDGRLNSASKLKSSGQLF